MRSRMLTVIGAVLFGLACSLPAQTLSQTLPVGFDSTPGGATSPFTFGTFPNADQVWQFHYANSNFNQTGPILITELYIRADRGNASINAFNFPNLTVTIGEAITGYAVGQHQANFAANFGPNPAVVRTGAWTGGPIAAGSGVTAPWVALNLTQGYLYDPSRGLDLIIQVDRCGAATPWSANIDHVSGTGIGGNRYGAVGNCAATTSTTNGNDFCPVFRIDYVAQGGFAYETNDASASLTVDGVVGNVYNKAVSRRCTGNTINAVFRSSSVGMGWDVGVNGAPLVSAQTGGILSGSGQIVNLNLAAPGGTFFLNGGLFPSFAVPFPVSRLEIPVILPGVTGFLSAQSVHVDPTNADGIAISQGCEVEILSGAMMVPGPTGDDSFVSIPLSGPQLCGPISFPFYGTRYTDLHVISNGRITFGRPDTQYAPTGILDAQNGEPFVGAWTDFNPNVGGTVNVVNTGATLRVDYTMVPYFSGVGGPNTFSIELTPGSGVVQITGLLGLTASAGDLMFLGMSPGLVGAAGDPGPANFASTAGTTSNANDMIYEIGGSGSLAPGINSIFFLPNMVGNYDWTSL